MLFFSKFCVYWKVMKLFLVTIFSYLFTVPHVKLFILVLCHSGSPLYRLSRRCWRRIIIPKRRRLQLHPRFPPDPLRTRFLCSDTWHTPVRAAFHPVCIAKTSQGKSRFRVPLCHGEMSLGDEFIKCPRRAAPETLPITILEVIRFNEQATPNIATLVYSAVAISLLQRLPLGLSIWND